MTDFNQKTHDTDVGSHGGQSRQMMEVFENQEFGSIRVLQEAGKTFFCASDVAKALGYVNPYAAVKRHCRGPLTKREGVVQKVNQYGDAGKQVSLPDSRGKSSPFQNMDGCGNDIWGNISVCYILIC